MMKPRMDRFESRLTETQRGQIRDWLKSHTYIETKALIKKTFGIQASQTALHRFFHSRDSSQVPFGGDALPHLRKLQADLAGAQSSVTGLIAVIEAQTTGHLSGDN